MSGIFGKSFNIKDDLSDALSRKDASAGRKI